MTEETLNTERKVGSAYQAGHKQDAPTVEANSKALKAFNRYSMATMPFTLIEYLEISTALQNAAK